MGKIAIRHAQARCLSAHEQIRWLEDYREARAKDPSAEAVKQVMTAKYPGYANDFIFVFSEKVRKH